MNYILTYTREGAFKGLNNAELRKLGGNIELYEGLPDFFDQIKHFAATNPEYGQVNNLQKQNRVHSFGEANYTEGSQTSMWIKNAITEISNQIVKNRERALGDKICKPPKHLE